MLLLMFRFPCFCCCYSFNNSDKNVQGKKESYGTDQPTQYFKEL